ncbi:10334_t:CDS:2 [Dentiscutata heterogama]|uniref:10334_t:CDS:1 n=1 Tax=Dentiscutata heterogama TaxID=1316150 RepID=A0ACA9K4J1_9GLOM|nr:10334_t:CDS:2 [Dentiscutata heterogama]
MDDNFVKFDSTNEPTYGIKENKWIFKTISRQKQEQYSDKAIGVVRLTQDGTRLYDSLSQTKQSEFLNNFQQELIISIPMNSERLQLTNRIVPSQYLLQIEILPTKDLYQDSVSQIVNTITELIKDKDTIIYMNNYTKYLDSSYGFIINRTKLHDFSNGFYFRWATLFIVINGKDVPWLNLRNKKKFLFIKWLKKYKTIASVFTICSSVDITLFEFLTSRFAGFEIFDAPFSDFLYV